MGSSCPALVRRDRINPAFGEREVNATMSCFYAASPPTGNATLS
jgi:hypothetical protein